MRVRIIKAVEQFKVGEIHDVNEKVAKFLLKNGYAVMSKDITGSEMQTRNLSDGNSK